MSAKKKKPAEPTRFLPRDNGGYFTMGWQDMVLEQYGVCCETCRHWRPAERRTDTNATCSTLSQADESARCLVGTPHRFFCFAWEQFEAGS